MKIDKWIEYIMNNDILPEDTYSIVFDTDLSIYEVAYLVSVLRDIK